MRVITGKAKGMKLLSIDSTDTRPTLDRIKVVMFDLINNDYDKKIVLDLFSGSGALGIEALSRGASECHFVDNNQMCVKVIEENLKKARLDEFAFIHNTNVEKAIEMFTNSKKFDIIFLDPPYSKDYLKTTIDSIIKSNLLTDNGIIVVEKSKEENIELDNVRVVKFREFKKRSLYILEKRSNIGG